MDLLSLLLFVPACFALNMTPGPNNLLAMNNARCYGFRASMIGSLGRILAFSAMITLTASGLAVILYASETVFSPLNCLARSIFSGLRFNCGVQLAFL